jgi:HK97 family phage major capsid protein
MTVISAQHRERFQEAQRRKRAARDRQHSARKAVEMARDDFERQAGEAALAEATGELEIASELEAVFLRQAAGLDGGLGEATFLEDPAVVEQLRSLAYSKSPVGRMDLGQLAGREQLVDILSTGRWAAGAGGKGGAPAQQTVTGLDPTSIARTTWFGVVPQIRRPLSVLDLIPTSATEQNVVAYTQETGTWDTGAAETVEGALKPEGDVTYTDVEARCRTIAEFVKNNRQQLDDVAGLADSLQRRLTYKIGRRVERQIVAGDGTGENLTGILSTTGIGSIAFVASTAPADMLLKGVTALQLAEAIPNGVLIHPTDLATMLTTKASGSGERLDIDSAVGANVDNVWSIPLVATPLVAVGTALVGDFMQGCELFVRDGISLRVSDNDQDDFVRNRITTLAETRVALAVWQPACFTKVALA